MANLNFSLRDYLSASTIVKYRENDETKNEYLFSEIMPSLKQDKLKIAEIQEATGGTPQVLKSSALDAEPELRAREAEEGFEERDLIFFREGIALREADRRELMLIEDSGNLELLNNAMGRVVDDRAELIAGAEVRCEQMRVDALVEGKIVLNGNGIVKTYDYGMDSRKANVAVNWSAPATSTPIADFNQIQKDNPNVKFTNAVMSQKTFNQLVQSKEIKSYLEIAKEQDYMIFNQNKIKQFIATELGLNIIVDEDVYLNENGEKERMFPEDVVLLLPSGSIGNTIFAPTPEEFDYLRNNELANPNMDIALYNNAITVISEYEKTVPVQIRTTASMLTIPTITRKEEIVILNTKTA